MIIPKSFFPQVCLFALVSCCLPSFSAPKEVPPNPREALKAGRPDHNRSMLDFHRKKRPLGDEQIELLHSLLDAPPERLRVIRQTVERIESMSPEQRRGMKARLKRFRDKSPHDRSKMMSDFKARQDFLNRHWRTLDPPSRTREMNRFRKMDMGERTKYLERIRAIQKGSEARPSNKSENP